MEGPHEWCLTLSTTSRVPKPVYEALLGTLYSDLVFREGSEWKFGTGTRNVRMRSMKLRALSVGCAASASLVPVLLCGAVTLRVPSCSAVPASL